MTVTLPILCPTCGCLVPREYSGQARFLWAPPLDSGWEPTCESRVRRCPRFHGFQYNAQEDFSVALTLPTFIGLFNGSPMAVRFQVQYDHAAEWQWIRETQHFWSLKGPTATFTFGYAPGPAPTYRPWGLFPPITDDPDAAMFWALCAAWYVPTGNEPRG